MGAYMDKEQRIRIYAGRAAGLTGGRAPVCNAFGCGWSPPPRRASSSNSSPVFVLDLSAAVGPLPAIL